MNSGYSIQRGESIFRLAKRRLDLALQDESHLNRHVCIHFTLLWLRQSMIPTQSHSLKSTLLIAGLPPIQVASTIDGLPTTQVVFTMLGLLVLESSCSNYISWYIGRILASTTDFYKNYNANDKQCSAKWQDIAKLLLLQCSLAFRGYLGLRRLSRNNFSFVAPSLRVV